MILLTWLFTGILCGLAAALLMRPSGDRKLRMHMVLGMIGAVATGLVISPRFNIEIINQKSASPQSILVGLIGAVVFLAGFYLYRRLTRKELDPIGD